MTTTPREPDLVERTATRPANEPRPARPAGTRPRVSVIVPCYNEEGAVLETIRQLRDVLESVGSYEIVVVDDGSTDATGEYLRQAEREHTDGCLKVIRHERNRGYGAALKTGIRRATSELIAITDADGTYPNERLPEFVELAEHADMVVGSRTADDVTYPLIRKIPKAFLRRYAEWVSGHAIPDMNSGMRVFRKDVAENYFKILPDGFSFTTTITVSMLRNRYDVRFVPIGYSARIGKSKIKPIRDTLRFAQLLVRTGMYFAPLRVLAPLIGLLVVFFLGSLAYDAFVLRNLTDKTILLLLFAMNTAIFAMVADMIDKRSPS